MGKPSVPTQKRLFAVSGNRCAFRNCRQPLVDESTGKVTARICHIKGNKDTSKRYNPSQPEEERQGFDNLILMCPVHHDVIDADDLTFTEDVLRALKAEHEAKHRAQPQPSTRAEELFLANVVVEVSNGSIILSANQSGGQIAHIIHNNYGTAPHQPQSAFRVELAKRHLADVDDPEFARTIYQKKVGFVQGDKIQTLRTSAIAFAHFPRYILTPAEEPAFLKWANCNDLRCEPCKVRPFIPGPFPDRIGSALVWSDGMMQHGGPGYLCYMRYLALERAGWVEYGYCPLNLRERTHVVYYAQLIANLVGFLGLVRQLAVQRGIDPATLSLGVGLRGIKGAGLECVTSKLVRGYASVTPPDRDNLLFLRSSEDGPWEINRVAQEFADSILQHWEFARPGWLADAPEFEAGAYKGEFFRESFSHR
jgi:hypothetical protein